jgi:hypothetical protein
MCVQQNATLHSLFYLETALHVSGGTTTHHQERKQLYLQHLVFVTPLLLPAAIAAGSSNGVTDRHIAQNKKYDLKLQDKYPELGTYRDCFCRRCAVLSFSLFKVFHSTCK